MVILFAIQLVFGVVVNYGAYHIFSKGIVGANAIALEAIIIKGISIGGVSYVGLSALVIVGSEQAPAAHFISFCALVGQGYYEAVIICFADFLFIFTIGIPFKYIAATFTSPTV